MPSFQSSLAYVMSCKLNCLFNSNVINRAVAKEDLRSSHVVVLTKGINMVLVVMGVKK